MLTSDVKEGDLVVCVDDKIPIGHMFSGSPSGLCLNKKYKVIRYPYNTSILTIEYKQHCYFHLFRNNNYWPWKVLKKVEPNLPKTEEDYYRWLADRLK